MTTVLLAWSEADLSIAATSDYIVPLTATTYIASKSSGVRLIDPQELLLGSPTIEQRGLEILNRLHQQLAGHRLGWLEGFGNIAFGVQVFQFLAWLTLLRKLSLTAGKSGEIVLPKFIFEQPREGEVFLRSLAREALLVAAIVARREGVRLSQFDTTPTKDNARKMVGFTISPINESVQAFTVAKNPSMRFPLGDISRAEVLLVTQQYNDAVHAVPFARQLHKRFGDSFLWLGPRPRQASNLTSEESALIGSNDYGTLNFVDTTPIYTLAEGGSRLSRLADCGGAWAVAGVLDRYAESGVCRGDWFRLLSGPQYQGFAIRSAMWGNVLNAVRPKVVAAFSALQDMALVRAWARRKPVPFVMLMHGAFPSLRRSHDADADYIGVFGEYLADKPLGPAILKPKVVTPCGPMQFAEKLVASRNTAPPSRAALHGDVLLFGSFESLPFAPVSPVEQWELLDSIHRACLGSGRRLKVRLHPRFPRDAWIPYTDYIEQRFPGSIEISAQPSMAIDLQGCVCAVSIHFDGAMMDAMLMGKPVLSFVPGGHTQNAQTEPLGAAGGLCRDFSSLLGFLGRSDDHPDWLALVDGQRRFLSEYFGRVDEDIWGASVCLVDAALEDAVVPLDAS